MATPFGSDPARIARQGLSEGDAQNRLRIEGPNELPRSKRRQVWGLVREPIARGPASAPVAGRGLSQ